jgi:hypothetical protein
MGTLLSRNLRDLLRALEDLAAQERTMYALDNRKDQIMTICKLALANLAMWARDQCFPASYAHVTWTRLAPFFQLTRTSLSLHMCCDRCRHAPASNLGSTNPGFTLRTGRGASGALHIAETSPLSRHALVPFLSSSGKAGVLTGYIALNLLPFKGHLTSAETAHTDDLSSQHRGCRMRRESWLRWLRRLLQHCFHDGSAYAD